MGTGGGPEVEAEGGERGGEGEEGFRDDAGIEEGRELAERGDEVVGVREGGGDGNRSGGGERMGEEKGKEGAWPSHAVITLWLNEQRSSVKDVVVRGGLTEDSSRREAPSEDRGGERRRRLLMLGFCLFDRRLFIGKWECFHSSPPSPQYFFNRNNKFSI